MVCDAQDFQPSSTGSSVRSRLIRNILGTDTPPHHQQHHPSNNLNISNNYNNHSGQTDPLLNDIGSVTVNGSTSSGNGGGQFRRVWDEFLVTAAALPLNNRRSSSSTAPMAPQTGDETAIQQPRSSRWRPGGIGYFANSSSPSTSIASPSGLSAADDFTYRQERRRSMVRQLVEQNIVVLRRAHGNSDSANSTPASTTQQSSINRGTQRLTVLGRRQREEESMDFGDDIPTHFFHSDPPPQSSAASEHLSVRSRNYIDYQSRSSNNSATATGATNSNGTIRPGMISFPLHTSQQQSAMQESGTGTSARTLPTRQAILQQAMISSWFPYTSGSQRSSTAATRLSSRVDDQPLVPYASDFEDRDNLQLTLRRSSTSGTTDSATVTATSSGSSNTTGNSIDRTPLYRMLRDSQQRRESLQQRRLAHHQQHQMTLANAATSTSAETMMTDGMLEVVDPMFLGLDNGRQEPRARRGSSEMMRRFIRVMAESEQSGGGGGEVVSAAAAAATDATDRPLC
jgi:hypothetical protein